MTHESQKQDNCKWKKNSSFNYCFHSQKRPAIESNVAQIKKKICHFNHLQVLCIANSGETGSRPFIKINFLMNTQSFFNICKIMQVDQIF